MAREVEAAGRVREDVDEAVPYESFDPRIALWVGNDYVLDLAGPFLA